MTYENMMGFGNGESLPGWQVVPNVVPNGLTPAPAPITTSTTQPPQVLLTNGNGATAINDTSASNSDALTTTHQVGGGTLRVHWGGVAMTGLVVVFFWWFWKKWLPGMKAIGERERVV